jgi:HPt (histidine-containing phosphotransfer) domain-containing protein
VRLEGLRNALREEDAVSLARLAHAMKGSAANLGARGMAAICADVEACAAEGDLKAAPVRVGALDQEFDRVRSALVTIAMAA